MLSLNQSAMINNNLVIQIEPQHENMYLVYTGVTSLTYLDNFGWTSRVRLTSAFVNAIDRRRNMLVLAGLSIAVYWNLPGEHRLYVWYMAKGLSVRHFIWMVRVDWLAL